MKERMFERASKLKLRFNTEKGMVTTEDLWDLPLLQRNAVDLDSLAKNLNKAVKESGEESFVLKKLVKLLSQERKWFFQEDGFVNVYLLLMDSTISSNWKLL